MKIKAITNLREFIFDTEEMKLQNRGGVGVSIFGLAKNQLRKGEKPSKNRGSEVIEEKTNQ